MVIQDYETPARTTPGLKALTDDYGRRFAPVCLAERFLVETLAFSEWRVRQYTRMEAAIWRDPLGTHGWTSKDLDRLHRLGEQAQRTYAGALTRLMAVQKKRAGKSPAAPRTSGLFVVPKRSCEQR